MLVASGIGACAATSAIPSRPGVGSSRYSRMPASPEATLTEVCGVQAALGSRRSGIPGNAAASASIAAISSSGANTPPLSLTAVKPYSSTMRRAWATMPSGSSAAPNASGSAPGWATHL